MNAAEKKEISMDDVSRLVAQQLDWVGVQSVEEGLDVWRKAIAERCGTDEALRERLVGTSGILTEGLRPTDSMSAGDSFEEYIKLAGEASQWTVEADMQLSELLMRVANRERVTPQNLSCHSFEKVVGTAIDLTTMYPDLAKIPMQQLIARAAVLRVLNQKLSYSLPYLSLKNPDEQLQQSCNGCGGEELKSYEGGNNDNNSQSTIHKEYGSSFTRFPNSIGVENTLREVQLPWTPFCVARTLRSLRRLIFSSTKREFFEGVIDASTTITPLPQDEYEVSLLSLITIPLVH